MKRRNFIPLMGLGILAIALPTWYYKYHELEYDQLLTEPELLSYIWDSNTISKIGEIYGKHVSSENSEHELVTLLLNNVSADTITTEMLQQQITNDYKTGNTVMVDGWILSKTEARQCALFSLTHND